MCVIIIQGGIVGGGCGMMGEVMLSGCVRWPIYNGLNIVILESGNKYFTEIFCWYGREEFRGITSLRIQEEEIISCFIPLLLTSTTQQNFYKHSH